MRDFFADGYQQARMLAINCNTQPCGICGTASRIFAEGAFGTCANSGRACFRVKSFA